MAGPKTLNLIIYQGEKPYSVDLTFAGYDFTGCSGRAQVKDRSGNLLFQLAVTFPAPDKCRISYADTTLLAAARGAAWDLFITYSDGTVRPEVRGFAYVLEPGAIAPKSCNDAAASGFAVAITAAQQGPPGPPGTGGGSGGVPLPSLPAATALSALRVVSADGANYAYSNPLDPDSVWSIAGLTPSAIGQGQPCTPIRNQPISDGGWNWDTSKPIVLGPNGTLTQSEAVGWAVQIATPLSPQTIFIQIERPIEL